MKIHTRASGVSFTCIALLIGAAMAGSLRHTLTNAQVAASDRVDKDPTREANARPNEADQFSTYREEPVTSYNEHIDEVPHHIWKHFDDEPAKRTVALTLFNLLNHRFAGERIPVRVTTDEDGVTRSKLRTDTGTHLIEFEHSELPVYSTVRVSADESTLREIGRSDGPTQAVVDAVERDGITVGGISIDDVVWTRRLPHGTETKACTRRLAVTESTTVVHKKCG